MKLSVKTQISFPYINTNNIAYQIMFIHGAIQPVSRLGLNKSMMSFNPIHSHSPLVCVLWTSLNTWSFQQACGHQTFFCIMVYSLIPTLYSTRHDRTMGCDYHYIPSSLFHVKFLNNIHKFPIECCGYQIFLMRLSESENQTHDLKVSSKTY